MQHVCDSPQLHLDTSNAGGDARAGKHCVEPSNLTAHDVAQPADTELNTPLGAEL